MCAAPLAQAAGTCSSISASSSWEHPPLAQMEECARLPQKHPLSPRWAKSERLGTAALRDLQWQQSQRCHLPIRPRSSPSPHQAEERRPFFTDFAQQMSLQQFVVGLGRLFKEVMFLKVQRLVIEGKGFCFLESQRHSALD